MDDMLFGAGSSGSDAGPGALAREFARAFASASGRRVLEHLRAITLGRYLPPNASDAELRYLEGQRYLVSFISNMVDKGMKG